MATATTLRLHDLSDLDTAASIIEAAAKRVRTVILRGGLIAIGGVTCYYLHKAQRKGAQLRQKLSSANVQTQADRALMRDIASSLGQAARALDQAFAEFEKHRVSRMPVFGSMLERKLEDLVCAFEDMAETASLGADSAFARSVRVDLRNNLQPPSRHVRTA